ncbi:hypothetical protein BDK51DRAFT_39500 [Blyttiomyces helicus]|uniref:Uncharacterized protein n=1 Tax=Blyttiomyces helicus TaxID=388810 RepID=A0A4P9W422_9FUNG|nr:hypothetical protein BDK51DRAFT_39500 [Blyttiomyces helicus]|eukprot:RKO86013.1 hypothetical protein BDK51DRAFT_39500 [Blyttiomyces helicus]
MADVAELKKPLEEQQMQILAMNQRYEAMNQRYEAQISALRNDLAVSIHQINETLLEKATAAAEKAINNILARSSAMSDRRNRLRNVQQARNFARGDLTRDETTKTHCLWFMFAAFAVLIASVIFTSISISEGNPFSTIAPIISSVLITAVPGTFITVKLFLDAIVSVTWTRDRIVALETTDEEVTVSNANLTKEVTSLSGEVAATTFNESHENVWHELQTLSRRHTSVATIDHE